MRVMREQMRARVHMRMRVRMRTPCPPLPPCTRCTRPPSFPPSHTIACANAAAVRDACNANMRLRRLRRLPLLPSLPPSSLFFSSLLLPPPPFPLSPSLRPPNTAHVADADVGAGVDRSLRMRAARRDDEGDATPETRDERTTWDRSGRYLHSSSESDSGRLADNRSVPNHAAALLQGQPGREDEAHSSRCALTNHR